MNKLRIRAIHKSKKRQEQNWRNALKSLTMYYFGYYTSQFMEPIKVGAPMYFRHPTTYESLTITVIGMDTRKNGTLDLTLRVKRIVPGALMFINKPIKINIPYYGKGEDIIGL